MFDPKAIAKKLAGKGGVAVEIDSPDEESSDGNPGPSDALRDMFSAMKSGDFDAAADAFRAAVSSCNDDDYKE